ncbi:sugar transferase [Eubacterium limosum]|uniref:Sugar transferase n=1 Tax=Eubacterium limosum TaxID=1736 RepID=A0ABT5UT51_EUBLI|nr:sugar transferase [Eubacterium limosum]MDE1471021.1 sugar transferase [Eubacterium limosum]
MIYQKYIKRILDITLSGAAIIVLAPVMGVTTILVKKKLGRPVIFKQKRPGLNGKIFDMYKFRTMTEKKDSSGDLLSDEIRLTDFGKKLRNTSLDELPELYCILKGDMSIVGPRPQLVRDMVFMNDEQLKRHSVRPGLTGWAQVNGRNAISWERKLEYDLEYIKNVTFRQDLKIIFMTVIKAFIKKEGITEKNVGTATDYGDYLLKTGMVSQKKYNQLQRKARVILVSEN